MYLQLTSHKYLVTGTIHLKVVASLASAGSPAEKEAASRSYSRLVPQIRNPPRQISPSDKDPSDIPE